MFRNNKIPCLIGAGLAQYSDQAACWTTGESVSISGRAGDLSLLHWDQTVSGIQPASYPAGTEGCLLAVKVAWA